MLDRHAPEALTQLMAARAALLEDHQDRPPAEAEARLDAAVLAALTSPRAQTWAAAPPTDEDDEELRDQLRDWAADRGLDCGLPPPQACPAAVRRDGWARALVLTEAALGVGVGSPRAEVGRRTREAVLDDGAGEGIAGPLRRRAPLGAPDAAARAGALRRPRPPARQRLPLRAAFTTMALVAGVGGLVAGLSPRPPPPEPTLLGRWRPAPTPSGRPASRLEVLEMRLRILGKGPFHSTQMILRVRNPTPRALVGRLLAPARPGAYLDVVSGPAPTVRGVVPPEGYALAIGPLGPGEAAEVRASWNQDLRRGPGGLVRHHLDLPAAAGPYAARVDVAWTGATHHPAQGTGWMAEAAEVRGNQAFESRVRLDGTDGASYRLDLRVEPGEVRPDGPRPPDPAPPILPPWSELAPRPEALGPAASTPRAASLAPPAEVARPPAGPSPEATVRPPSTTDDGRVEVYLGTRKTLVRPWMPGPSGSR